MRDPARGRVRIGLSACFWHPEEFRIFFPGKTLLFVEQSMVNWVQSGGALTYPIPTADAAAGAAVTVDDYVHDLDGLVLHGGADVCPRTYGEEPLRSEWEGDEIRDRYDIALIRAFLAAGKPVLGICRGAQILNVALGGTLYQDLETQGVTPRAHREAERYDRVHHEVDLVLGSGLAAHYPDRLRVTVNSVHHQGIRELAPGLVVEARSAEDGVIEAVRLAGGDADGRYAVGVQWHPEFMFALGDPEGLDNAPILREFLARATVARDGEWRRTTAAGRTGPDWLEE
jgi:putative glutamine amidotransferase